MKMGEGADNRDTCHKHVTLLGAFMDGVLDAANTLEVDEHLAHCESCRERVELDRAVRGSLKKAMGTVKGGDAMRDRMLAAMMAAKSEAKSEALEKQSALAIHTSHATDAGNSTLAANSTHTASSLAAGGIQDEFSSTESSELSLDSDYSHGAHGPHGSREGQGSNESRSSSMLEQAREARDTQTSLRKEALRLASWRTLVPLATAAALALVWNGVAQTAPQGAHQTDVMRAGFGHDPLADLVAQHSQPPLPPERTDPKDLRGFERYVGVPVHAPHFRGDARLVGGRVTTVHHERAAMLQYELGHGSQTQRVTVFIYDPRKIQIGRDRLTPRAIGTSEVRVGREDGYSVAVRTGVDAGVGYTMVSDLDPERSAELVAVTTEDD